ncbi:LuxR family transcriptional regulator [Mycolicibacterium sp. P1-18]|uniref:AAA family ATPase n=1 Tax=Mycolicibacterium sp. P1-18 TaxID=2024615 RepID=UPI0011F1318B|nr:LuxR family transcriptional regulator [Mycolicibacterium sp. P1-18]KAA0100033.1 LuxR family transcriptional regulator [Mycolicibacterium sp. P1-18]
MATTRRSGRGGTFVGRRTELDVMAELVDAARHGRSGSVVLRATAGLGKTYLLDRVVDEYATDMQVIAISGIEAETVFDYAALQRLCSQLLGHVDRLPELQRRALKVAMGAESGDPPDPFLVGLAVVNLLSEAGAQRPLLCIVDDAQWIDDVSRQALGFAARRLQADRVAMIFATRDADAYHLDGLRQLRLPPLTDAESRTLLDAVLPGRLDHRVRDRLLGEAAGNPLALTEMPVTLTPGELAGGFGLVNPRTSPGSVEDVFTQRLQALPERTRLLLLIAAAEPAGEAGWLWAAAERLGLGVDDAAAAEAAGLVRLDTRIGFRHPLVRAAIYRSEPAAQRHRVHAALAETITGPDAADYRTWHRAHAISTPLEAIAAELVVSAERARHRGGIAAAAAFLTYSVELTPDAGTRARRALGAAAAKLDAGDIGAATRLVDTAAATTVDAGHHARVALMRARLAFASDRGREGPRLLLAAARELADLEPDASRDTYLEALMAAMIVGRLAEDADGPVAVAVAARRAPPPATPPRSVDLLLDALITRFTDGYVTAAPALKKALLAYLRDVHAGTADPRWHDVTNRICLDLYDFSAYAVLAGKQLEMLRAAGELTVLPAALTTLAAVHAIGGEFDAGQALLDEALVVASATGAPPHRSATAFLAAHRGDEELWRTSAGQTVSEGTDRGEGTELTVALLSKALLHNGLSWHEDALDACRSGLRYDDIGLYGCLLIETVEAAAYSGHHNEARDAAAELVTRATASPTESALGLAARATAIAKGAEATDVDFQQAIAHLERSPLAVYRARTHLVYGEWLRRHRGNGDAVAQLRLAHDLCTRIGADAFAERAARELEAAGGAAAQRNPRYDAGLTARERHISRLVRQGLGNAEVADKLLISHRTVEWHLRNIYNKLGVTSRRELRLVDL